LEETNSGKAGSHPAARHKKREERSRDRRWFMRKRPMARLLDDFFGFMLPQPLVPVKVQFSHIQ
jgi:hypothetical protein